MPSAGPPFNQSALLCRAVKSSRVPINLAFGRVQQPRPETDRTLAISHDYILSALLCGERLFRWHDSELHRSASAMKFFLTLVFACGLGCGEPAEVTLKDHSYASLRDCGAAAKVWLDPSANPAKTIRTFRCEHVGVAQRKKR